MAKMTSAEWVRRMRVLGDFPNSQYRNRHPYNVLYWDGTRWWADCVNLQKALFNGRGVDNPGAGTYQSDLSATGDCNEWGLISQCTDVSNDFSTLTEDVPEVLYMDGHIGAYLGCEFRDDYQGGTVNCIEATSGWGGGILYSYVDAAGRRYNRKGGSQAGTWTHHGKPTKWVSYPATPQPEPEPDPEYEERPITYQEWEILNIWRWTDTLQRGVCNNYVKVLQGYLAWYNYYGGNIDGDYSDKTEAAVRKWQKANGLTVTGKIGPADWALVLTGKSK